MLPPSLILQFLLTALHYNARPHELLDTHKFVLNACEALHIDMVHDMLFSKQPESS